MNFLQLPAKRPGSAYDPDPISGSATKRVKQHSPLCVPPGHVSFRMLCRVSQVGAVIGKSGSIIKQLQQSTESKIRVEDAPTESPDRVITIVASANPTSTMKLHLRNPRNSNNAGMGEEIEEIEVSRAQEALVRVFEAVIGGGEGGAEVVVSCRLLAEASHAGAVIGKGGKVVERMRKETGCKISVLTEKLPACAKPDEEMVEIEGDVLAVKRALLSVSRCLQDYQPINKMRMLGSRPADGVPQETTLHRPINAVVQQTRPVEVLSQDSLHRSIDLVSPDALRGVVPHDALARPIELFPQDTFQRRIETIRRESFPEQHNSLLHPMQHSPISSVTGIHSVSESPSLDSKPVKQDVVFKILCSSDTAGGVIGKGGAIIRALQSESGATINVGNTLPDCDERLITVTAAENPEGQHSPAQKAVVLIFSRSVEAAIEKGLDPGLSKGSSIAVRLVVPTSQVGCLLGKGGAIVSEIRKVTGTSIQILKADQSPKCVSENDQIVQISGELSNVKEAICHVTSRLRENLFSSLQKGSGAKSTTSLIIETHLHGRSEDPLPTGFRPSVSYSKTLGTSPYGRSEDPLPTGFRPSVSYSKTLGTSPYGRLDDSFPVGFSPSVSYSQSFGRPSSLDDIGLSHSYSQPLGWSSALDSIGLSHSLDQPSSSGLWASKTIAPAVPRCFPDVGGGLASFKSGTMLGSGTRSAIVTNTTMEIRVPENVMGSVYGDNGRNLEQLRKISGARIIVHEPHLGTSDRIIVISGTPDQTQAAQNLLHAFILAGETSR